MAQAGTARRGVLRSLARAGVGLCALAPATLMAADAQADAIGSAELSWVRASGAESCPPPSAMRAAVARRLGRDPFERDAAVSFEVVVEPRAPGWAARIVAQGTTQGAGSRELTSEAAACESLADAVALALALAIDPEAMERTAREPAPTPALAAPTTPAPPIAVVASGPPPASAPAPGAAEFPRAIPYVLGLASVGLLPGGALGIGLLGELGLAERVSASVALDYWPERETAGAGGHFAFGLTAASLGLCGNLVRLPVVGLALCAAGMLGSVHAVVLDLEPTGPGDRLWAAARAGARLWIPEAGPLRAAFGLEAILPFTRHRFTVRDEPGDVFRQSAVALHTSLGAGLRF